MKPYPINVPRKSYRGSKPRLLEAARENWRVAEKIEKFVNDDLKTKPDNSIYQYMSYIIASEISENAELVRELIQGVDGGSNGMTIYKGDYEQAIKNIGST